MVFHNPHHTRLKHCVCVKDVPLKRTFVDGKKKMSKIRIKKKITCIEFVATKLHDESKVWTISSSNLYNKREQWKVNKKSTQLTLAFGRLGFNTNHRTNRTTEKAGMVVRSNSTFTFLCFVQWIWCMLDIVLFTYSTNLHNIHIYIFHHVTLNSRNSNVLFLLLCI